MPWSDVKNSALVGQTTGWFGTRHRLFDDRRGRSWCRCTCDA